MFTITQEAIDTEKLKTQACNDKAGALVIFEGWVRNHNEGKQVSSLEYEAYEELANREAAKIIEEANINFERNIGSSGNKSLDLMNRLSDYLGK